MEMKLNNKGQTLVEYVLIISLITVVAMALVKIFGGYLKDTVTKMGCEMMGKQYKETYNEKGKVVRGEGYCEGEESSILGN